MLVNMHILYLFSHCVSFALLIIDFIVILHVRLIRVLLKINQSINITSILRCSFVTYVVKTAFMRLTGSIADQRKCSEQKRVDDRHLSAELSSHQLASNCASVYIQAINTIINTSTH